MSVNLRQSSVIGSWEQSIAKQPDTRCAGSHPVADCSGTHTNESASLPGANGKIAFESTATATTRYTRSSRQHRYYQLTDNPADDVQPAWSPSGDRVHASEATAASASLVMDGPNECAALTNDPLGLGPTWSPDGKSTPTTAWPKGTGTSTP